MILLTATQTLEIVLAANITTSQLTYTTHYIDEVLSTFQLGAIGASDGVTNNTTAITAVGAPAVGRVRKISGLSLYNGDTVASITTIRVNDNGTTRIIWKGLIIDGDTLIYTDLRGFGIINSAGEWRVGISNISSGSSASTAIAAHATTHESGGTDVIPLDTLGTPSDVTTLNASTAKHGLLPKLSGAATDLLNGVGNWLATTAITAIGTIVTGVWNATKIGLAYGGTNADLSATGGTGKVLRQSSAGAAVTVATLASSDLSNSSNIPLLNAGNTFSAVQAVSASDSAGYGQITCVNTGGHSTGLGTQDTTDKFYIRSAVSGTTLLSATTAGNTTIAGTLAVSGAGDTIISGNLKTATSQNFSWNAKTVTTVYQAASDGFVVAVCDASAGGSRVGQIIGYTDSSNPPTTIRGGAEGSSGGPFQGSFMMPVVKGDFYKTVSTDLIGTCTYTMWWVPLGTAG